ncbi:hypothetical protein [Pontibacter cellulosilyticus]|uniref:Uncharacterized protein n=1 Tax=Pontibacter cellulosilyticus TaxID=1720253 RepID=A0A923SI46_9BACT|nr:hypothetical protein [Pontibacter cellulosilyticus]MBC5992424.1 hypothetical protein [Pontibacter cellulosilyticus]
MMLQKNLLFAQEEQLNNYSLDGTSIKGSYSTMQFALRLRKDIRDAQFSDFLPEQLQAKSTVLHENIHWWQHMGSNFGFLFSLSYPAFIHYSLNEIREVVKDNILFKSLLKFDKEYFEKNGIADLANLNVVINNYYDIEYAKLFALSNQNILKLNEDRRFFLNIGHCYHIFWVATVHTLSDSIDKDYNFLPPTNSWSKEFQRLGEEKVVGFYVDSPLQLTQVGIKAIYEGQAIFNQAQYLTGTLNRDLTYSDFVNRGMFYGIYTEAFDLYIKITGYSRPENLLDPIVGLFLLICDMAINPNNGFPLDIYDFENFITKNDPGIRFTLICKEVSKKAEYYRDRISQYSKEEYVLLSKELATSIGCACSYESISEVLKWREQDIVKEILKEEDQADYTLINLPIRLLFSKYLRFQEDKLEHPNILCWAGYHLSNLGGEFDTANTLYLKHHAIFMDDDSGEIKATIINGKPKDKLLKSFNNFYAHNILYDLVLKWVTEEGEFKFDYKWLAGERAKTFTPTIKENFKKQFGIDIESIKPI